jgi:multidrug efflux pump subunit AcrA (membrane-fusion protein)
MTAFRQFPSAPARRIAAIVAAAATSLVAIMWLWTPAMDPTLIATVRRGALTTQLTTSGILRPIESLSYSSPVVGRDTEILELAPEGTHVDQGDLLARLDTSDLEREVERVRQELRQAQADLQTAETERQDAAANIRSVNEGEGALTVQEARTRFQLAQKRAARLRAEYEQLKPLLDRGFMTREELSKTADALEQSEEELALLQKRMDVTVQLTHPREVQRAALQLAQKEAQVQNVTARIADAESRLSQLRELVEACDVRARRPGLVVYEELLTANPRRKVRVGDRVSATQGLVTIPEVNRMMVDTSVSEAELHQIRPGQHATIRLEAFPDLVVAGRVARIGTLASAATNQPLDDKRFDLVIELDQTAADLRPEMTVRADIIVATVEDALLLPVNAVVRDDGELVVHVSGRTGIERRRVTVGASSDRFVAISDGLREGEHVLLVEPSSGSNSGPAAPSVTPQTTRPRGAFAVR